MSGAAEQSAVEEDKKPPPAEESDLAGEENKKPSGEEDRKSEPQGDGDTNKILAKDKIAYSESTSVLMGVVEMSRLPADIEEPTIEGGNTMIIKEQTHLLADAEEKVALKQVHLKKKKEKKRKRIDKEQNQLPAAAEEEAASKKLQLKRGELVQVKKEQQIGCAMIDKEQNQLMAAAEEEAASKKLQLKRSELVQVKKEQQMDGADKTNLPINTEEPASEAYCSQRWCATYSSLLRKTKRRLYKGSVLLDTKKVNRIVLHDDVERIVDAYYLKEGETIYPGVVFGWPCHKVEIGERIFHSKEDLSLPTITATKTKKERRDENNKKRLKRKRSDENREVIGKLRRNKIMRSPQAKLVGSSIGRFARVASLRKEMSPQAQCRNSESPSVPNVSVHFPSPNLPHAKAESMRSRPRKLKSRVWKEFIPIYEDGKLAEGQCKHCNEVCPASKASGTNHIHRHLKKCLTRSSMHEMVAKMRASISSPQVSSLDNWNFSQKESRRALSNMIVQHGLPFSIVEYSGFIKFAKSLNPMFKLISRTTVKDDCLDSYKEHKSMLRGKLKKCGARVSLTADMWTSNQRLGYLCVTCHFIDKTWKMQKRILRFCMMETPHNGFRMYNAMLKSLQYWNVEDKICSITLDNASVNGKMMEYLKENLMKKDMLNCGVLPVPVGALQLRRKFSSLQNLNRMISFIADWFML